LIPTPKVPNQTTTFYDNLQGFDNFDGITDLSNFQDLPEDWYVIITDIVNSTQAVKDGFYKEINMMGAAGVAAVGNLTGETQIPFVFGGDGATMAIPSEYLLEAQKSLQGVQKIAETFNLNLRVGIVPVKDVNIQNLRLQVAKWKVSKLHYQAIIAGSGWDWAENDIKRNPKSTYLINKDSNKSQADLSGFSCVWNAVPSPRGQTLTLIIKSLSQDEGQSTKTLNQIWNSLQKFYSSPDQINPLIDGQIKVDLSLKSVTREQKLNFNQKGLAGMWLNIDILLRRYFIKFIDFWNIRYNGIAIDDLRGDEYHADYRKFDNNLKLVIATDQVQSKNILALLNEYESQGKIRFGHHIASETVITCFVADAKHLKVRFVDGQGGGYTLAASELKSKLNNLSK